MFPQLFLKECKMILKSTVFYLYIIVLGAFTLTQASDFRMREKPVKGADAESYGKKESVDKKEIMKDTLTMLERDWENNSFVAYPIGVYKKVSLDAQDHAEVKDIIDRVNGQGENMDYEDFLGQMERVDQILEGNGTSSYAPSMVDKNSISYKSYEEALGDYQDIIETDHVSGAYARIFCDYLVLMMGILPVFLAVTRERRDRRAKADSLIYCRQTSSASIILSRYFATVVMGFLPVLLFAVSPLMQVVYYSKTIGVQADVLLYFEYLAGWLLPTMLTVVSVGFFFTELTGSAIGLLVQGIWWFIDIHGGMKRDLLGGFGLELMPRWNTVGETARFAQELQPFLVNRMIYCGIAAALLIGAAIIYDLKRKGRIRSYGHIFGNRKSKPKA